MKVYIAYRKGDGKPLSGARGQIVFEDIGSLNKSMAGQYWYKKEAKDKGFDRVRDMYEITEYQLGSGRIVQ